jgi:hypothetical protein
MQSIFCFASKIARPVTYSTQITRANLTYVCFNFGVAQHSCNEGPFIKVFTRKEFFIIDYQEENIVTLTNENATKGGLEKYLDQWLKNVVEKNGTVFIYYSGHGAPNAVTGDAYLVPYDGDPAVHRIDGLFFETSVCRKKYRQKLCIWAYQ